MLRTARAVANLQEPAVVDLLLAQSLEVAKLQVGGVRALEGKATAQIGIAGAILTLFTSFGRHMGGGAIAGLGFTLLLLCLVCSGVAIYIREDDLPGPALYNLRDVVSDPNNKPKITMLLIEAWKDYSLDLSVEAGRKARWVRWGSLLLLLGLAALVALSLTSRPDQPVMVNWP